MQKSGHFHLSKFYKGQQAKIVLKFEELKGQHKLYYGNIEKEESVSVMINNLFFISHPEVGEMM